ncbi:helix-turn-helix transcriptional regulator [Nocardioides sp. Kera G14]|uniref:helix-turn-helix transcriptional regulator n=1 Tax=Nocardioides sp. Kera G14 TaxID=2884264 RepID=UPI001D0F7F95|nr:helix-turn-helix transcriptional regulator [Nocardioides sp. Kera G14]UDY23180.1 helix-turn-helix transcriptional regulator [Nocardioides sp. Kera G14]
MAMRSSQTLLTALGFSRPVAHLYERILMMDGRPVVEVAGSFDLTVDQVTERLGPLLEADVVAVSDGRLLVRPPAEVVGRLLQTAAANATLASQRLQEIAGALPHLAGVQGLEPADEAEPIDGEVQSGPDGPMIARTIIRQSSGDLLWLRPDQWKLPWEDEMSAAVAQAIRDGRQCRALYPVRVLVEAPDVVRHRQSIGEEIRLLPELPTRMIVLGTSHLLLPEPLGYENTPRSIIRQRGLIELATLYFDALWAEATPVADEPAADPDELRRFLLAELARGAQDEQIARRLGISLRTVRRRVAEVMDELGAQSRFQAGVEAARRGWL